MLVIFSSGNMSDSGVSSPSTAKNSLTVGASTTGAFVPNPPDRSLTNHHQDLLPMAE